MNVSFAIEKPAVVNNIRAKKTLIGCIKPGPSFLPLVCKDLHFTGFDCLWQTKRIIDIYMYIPLCAFFLPDTKHYVCPNTVKRVKLRKRELAGDARPQFCVWINVCAPPRHTPDIKTKLSQCNWSLIHYLIWVKLTSPFIRTVEMRFLPKETNFSTNTKLKIYKE